MKLKRWLFPLGLVATLPLGITAVACGEAAPNNLTSEAAITAPSHLSADFAFENTPLSVAEDNLYLIPGTVKGELWSGTLASGAAREAKPHALAFNKRVGFNLPAYLLDDGDSIYVLFDNDDSDGISLATFTQNFFVYDTANPPGAALNSVNTRLGNQIDPTEKWGNLWLTFANGASLQALTQTETISASYEAALAKVAETLSPDELSALETYYTKASKGFKPNILPSGLFTYQQVAKNAMRLTFHMAPGPQAFGIKAAGFVLTNANSNETDQTKWIVQKYGEFAFGAPGWPAYITNDQREFVLRPKA